MTKEAPCLSSSEIIRRTNALFKNVDKLEELTLFLLERPKEKEGRTASAKFIAGSVLRGLKESKIKKTCGEVIYRAGVQEYMLGRVLEEKFADNTLLGRVGGKKSTSDADIQYFQPSITLERNARTIHTYGECQCTIAREGTICPHMAALMIAWVREPRKFAEDFGYRRTRFEKARQNLMSSLEELLVSLEMSSRAEVFALLQKTFSKLRRWGDGVKDVKRQDVELNTHFDPLREFSGTINYISLAIMATIERKYAVQAIDIYNRASLTTFGRVLELFVESTRYSGKSADSLARKERKKMPHNVVAAGEKTARSWDVLIENFANSRD
jgi:hypothetical protein